MIWSFWWSLKNIRIYINNINKHQNSCENIPGTSVNLAWVRLIRLIINKRHSIVPLQIMILMISKGNS